MKVSTLLLTEVTSLTLPSLLTSKEKKVQSRASKKTDTCSPGVRKYKLA